MVTAKGLTDQTALLTRREAWAEAYRATPHGTPVELAPSKPDGRWLLLGVVSTFAGYWLIHQINVAPPRAIPQVGFVASAALGSLLGMQHAFEPDHLAAVATLMTGERTSAKAAWLGAWWGLGHTLTLLAAGTALVVLRAEMPASVTMAFELGVVLMLVGFGARAIYQAACNALPRRTHSHAKPATSRLVDIDRWTLARPLLVGAVHGLAGSGALTALVVATLHRRRRGSAISRCLGSDRRWGWWRCRACWVGRSREWDLIVRSCARSHWQLAVSRRCSVCSGAIHSSVGCSRRPTRARIDGPQVSTDTPLPWPKET